MVYTRLQWEVLHKAAQEGKAAMAGIRYVKQRQQANAAGSRQCWGQYTQAQKCSRQQEGRYAGRAEGQCLPAAANGKGKEGETVVGRHSAIIIRRVSRYTWWGVAGSRCCI